jgi:gamma-glutamylcyclotransferase (GGCT)/AIG2-like uncharacterized protein YtfP
MTTEVALFVYGTLMDGKTVYALTGRHFPIQQAELPDFVRIIPQIGYPYILPRSGSVTPGLLLSGIDQASLAALDQYEDEGNLYHRCKVTVRVENRLVPCETYVGNVVAVKADESTNDQ